MSATDSPEIVGGGYPWLPRFIGTGSHNAATILVIVALSAQWIKQMTILMRVRNIYIHIAANKKLEEIRSNQNTGTSPMKNTLPTIRDTQVQYFPFLSLDRHAFNSSQSICNKSLSRYTAA